jgi:hypothetical protein
VSKYGALGKKINQIKPGASSSHQCRGKSRKRAAVIELKMYGIQAKTRFQTRLLEFQGLYKVRTTKKESATMEERRIG